MLGSLVQVKEDVNATAHNDILKNGVLPSMAALVRKYKCLLISQHKKTLMHKVQYSNGLCFLYKKLDSSAESYKFKTYLTFYIRYEPSLTASQQRLKSARLLWLNESES